MIKTFAKLGLWLVVGVGSIAALLGQTDFQTPWKYTVDSVIAPGTQITLTQPDGELVTMQVAEGQPLSGRKTFDIGAPLTLAGVYLISGIMAFGLKRRQKNYPHPG